MNVKKIAGAAIILAGIGIALASPAQATGGADHKEWILHPVAGKGELKNGYNCISPDKASSHFDEYGHPKHEAEGRVDKYDTEGLCNQSPTSTGSTTTVPTTSTSSSSSTTTTTTNSTTTTSTPSTSATTTIPTETTSTTSTPSETTTTAAGTPSTTSPPKEVVKPKPRTVTQPPAELAYTGPFNPVYTVVGLLLVLFGLIVTFGSTKIKVIRND